MRVDATSEIRERIDLLDLIGGHVRLQRTGGSFKGLCPFHEEKTPSFNVNPERKIWHCFGCGAHGDCFSFLMRVEALTFPEALARLAEKAGVKLDERYGRRDAGETEGIIAALAAAGRFFQKALAGSESARSYVSSRHIDDQTRDEFGLGFAPEGWDNLVSFLASEKVEPGLAVKAGLIGARSDGSFYDRFRNRLMFPVADSADRVVGFGGRDLGSDGPKYLNSPETPVFHKGSILYGYSKARKAIAASRQVIVVEGYLDVISAHRAGISTAVAAMGTAIGEGHTRLLKHLCDQVVICLDADAAGRKAALAAGEVFEAAGFDTRTATLPVGEDPDSLAASGRRDVLHEAIDKAVPAAEHRLEALLSAYDLSDSGHRTTMLVKACEMLGKVSNVFERDRLIVKLAAYHPSYARNPQQAEQRVRTEVERRARGGSAPAAAKPRPDHRARGSAPAPVSGLEVAERTLLKCLLAGGEVASGLARRVTPDLFVTDQGRALAQEALARISAAEELDWLAVSHEEEETGASRLASELMVQGDGPPVTPEVMEDCLKLLEAQSAKYTLVRLRERFNRGELTRDDPEYQRFLELEREKKR